MQNYRMNAVPYQGHRQMPMTPISNRSMWDDMSLAMAYVPWQTWCNIYEVEKGFRCGTIFKELDLPFLGKGGVKR